MASKPIFPTISVLFPALLKRKNFLDIQVRFSAGHPH